MKQMENMCDRLFLRAPFRHMQNSDPLHTQQQQKHHLNEESVQRRMGIGNV